MCRKKTEQHVKVEAYKWLFQVHISPMYWHSCLLIRVQSHRNGLLNIMIKATEILSFDWLLPYLGKIKGDDKGLCDWTVNRVLKRSSDWEQW